jgi:hypothetical protein
MKNKALEIAKELNVVVEDHDNYIKLTTPKGYVFMCNNLHETITDVDENNLWSLIISDLNYGIVKCAEDTCEIFAEELAQ